jgi:hypothetical protein
LVFAGNEKEKKMKRGPVTLFSGTVICCSRSYWEGFFSLDDAIRRTYWEGFLPLDDATRRQNDFSAKQAMEK